MLPRSSVWLLVGAAGSWPPTGQSMSVALRRMSQGRTSSYSSRKLLCKKAKHISSWSAPNGFIQAQFTSTLSNLGEQEWKENAWSSLFFLNDIFHSSRCFPTLHWHCYLTNRQVWVLSQLTCAIFWLVHMFHNLTSKIHINIHLFPSNAVNFFKNKLQTLSLLTGNWDSSTFENKLPRMK